MECDKTYWKIDDMDSEEFERYRKKHPKEVDEYFDLKHEMKQQDWEISHPEKKPFWKLW